MGKYVKDVQIINAEKRRIPNKYYVYVILVTWSDGSTLTIYRRYSRFFDLQTKLLDLFPIEGGSLDPAKRVIPFLPGKIIFGRSQIKDVAMKRLKELNYYCQKLIELDPKISQCEEVLDFFEVEPEDLDVPINTADEGCPLYVDGMLIGGVDPVHSKLKISKDKKAEQISTPKRLESYVAIAEYAAQSSGELTLNPGLKVEVLEKNENGWWFVNSEDTQGWVPSTYLEPEGGADPKALQVPVAAPGKEESFICIDKFEAESQDEVSLEKGAVVQVLQKNMDGWWLVRYNGKEAYAPGTVLKKVSNPRIVSVVEKSQLSGVEIISSLHDVSNLMNQNTKTDLQPEKEDKLSRASVIVKQRSLERGGNLVPPPRKNSVNKSGIPSSPVKTNVYMTVSDFTDSVGDGISFRKGQKVFVTEKLNSGWWYVKMGDNEGWVASSYLEPLAENLPSSSIHENVSFDEIDSGKHDSYDFEDEDWYEEPDETESDIPEISNESSAKRPLPTLPTDQKDKAILVNKNSKPLPSLPLKKPEGIKATPKEPASEGVKSMSRSKLQDVVLKPVDVPTKISVSKPPIKPILPSELKKPVCFESKTARSSPSVDTRPGVKPTVKLDLASEPQQSSTGSSLDFASQLRKFETRSAESHDKSDLKRLSGPVAKSLTQQKVATETNHSASGDSRPALKPLPPSKLKSSAVNTTFPLKSPATSETKPNIPANKPNTAKPPAPPLKPENSMNKFTGKPAEQLPESSIMKPLLPGKPKPALPLKSRLSNQLSGEQKSGDQNVNNFKLQFVQNVSAENNKSASWSSKPQVPSKKPGGLPAPVKTNAPVVSPLAHTYIAKCTFVAENEGELGFSEGDEVEVLEEQNDWCRIRCWDEEGWAPASYLQKL